MVDGRYERYKTKYLRGPARGGGGGSCRPSEL